MKALIGLMFAGLVIAGNLYAQESEEAENDVSEAMRQKLGAEFFYERMLSGEEKDFRKIRSNAYNVFRHTPNAAALKGAAIPAWQTIGGDQGGKNSGRSKNIAFAGIDTVYVAFAGGGVWKTTNINAQQPQWVNMTDGLPSIAFGAVATDPRNGSIVYAGTGEYITDRYKYPDGAGLFKSLDGGVNWSLILGMDTVGGTTSQIIVDPKNPDIVYVACGTARTSGESGGVLRSTDGGNSWALSTLTGTGVAPSSMVIDPIETNRLYVSTYTDNGSNGRMWKSIDSGVTWTQMTTGFPTSGVGRITLAISPSSPNFIYASVSRPNSTTYGLWGTTDHGESWRTFGNTPDPGWLGTQGSYDNSIVVHPTLPQRVFLAGLDIWQTTDTGKTFRKLTTWQNDGAPNYSHADVHHLSFNGSTLYANTDGSLTVGRNYGSTWSTSINKGIATLQFVGADADPSFSWVLGGCQDNGTNIVDVGTPSFTESRGGDGGNVFIVPNDPSISFSTYVSGTMYKSTQFGKKDTWTWLNTSFEGAAPFYFSYDFDANGSVGIAGGSSGLYITYDGGGDRYSISSTTIRNASATHVFRNDGTFMWAGVGSGVYRTTDGGGQWIRTSINGAATITGITSDPTNPGNLWVCSQGSGGSNRHVWFSNDTGRTYTSLPNFPNIGCNDIARQHSTGKIFVATDAGVIYTENNGETWYKLSEGMPNVIVTKIKVRGTNDDKLLASTYGRGVFYLDLTQLGTMPSASNVSSNFTMSSVKPNPIRTGSASVTLDLEKSMATSVTLYDVLGHEVRKIDRRVMYEGMNTVEFSTSNLSAGSYILVVTAGGESKTQTIIIE